MALGLFPSVALKNRKDCLFRKVLRFDDINKNIYIFLSKELMYLFLKA